MKLIVSRSDHFLHLQSGPDRAQGVVLLRDRCAEQRHQAVAKVMTDDSVMTVHDFGKQTQHTIEHVTQRFRLELLGESRRISYVGKQYGD